MLVWRVGMVGGWSVCPAFGTGCRRVRDLPTRERDTVLIWVRRRFRVRGCGGAHVERHAEFEGNSLYVWPAQALALLPGRSKAVLTRFLRAHLQTTYPPPERNHQARTNPEAHPQTLANPSDPNQNHPSIAPPTLKRPAKKGRRVGRPPLTRKLERWRGMDAHPPRGSNGRPKTEGASGSKRPC